MYEFKVLRTEPATIINLQQFTKHAETNMPLHSENGFFKIFPGADDSRRVEASYSHPFGMNEFEFGTITSSKLSLAATEERHFQRAHETDAADVEAKAK